MMRPLRSLIGRRAAAPPAPGPAAPDLPRPETATYVVGDLHGRVDALELMLELIDAHIGGTGSTDPRLVFVGDYVDHGPDSAAVLARMQELTGQFPDNVTCLMGNHERMLLDFLSDPPMRGPRWMRAGGAATLESYDIETDALEPTADASVWRDAAERFRAALGAAAQDWIAARPLSWQSGNLWVVHAGADPARDMAAQSARVLLWGHPEFEHAARGDDAWIAHGHVERDTPVFAEGRIGVDTAAWSTGKLTAVAIKPDGSHAFLQT